MACGRVIRVPLEFALSSRNEPVGPVLVPPRGHHWEPPMSSDRPAYDFSAWLLLVERIGGGLRQKYQAEELPPAWLTMLGRLDTKPEAQDRDY